MICPNCGSTVDDGVKFCVSCGAQLTDAEGTPAPTPEFTPAAAPAPVPASTSTPEFTSDPTPVVTPQPTPGYTPQPAPVATPQVAADMPSKTTALVLIIIGILCGLIWGVIGAVNYGGLSAAIDAGDVETAKKKMNIITTSTGIGVVLNILTILIRVLAG